MAYDHSLPPAAEVIGIVLSKYFNNDYGGAAWPSLRTIGDDAGIDKATAIRTLRAMEARGHLRIEWGKRGSGHVSKYWMADILPQVGQIFHPAQQSEKVHERTFKGAKKGALVSQKGAPAHQTLSKTLLNSPSKEGEVKKERQLRCARLPMMARAASKPPRHRKKKPTSKTISPTRRDRQRPWPDDDEREARKAFTEACREADPERFLRLRGYGSNTSRRATISARLTKWLARRGWEKAPPKKRERGKHRSLGDAMREAGERKAADTDETSITNDEATKNEHCEHAYRRHDGTEEPKISHRAFDDFVADLDRILDTSDAIDEVLGATDNNPEHESRDELRTKFRLALIHTQVNYKKICAKCEAFEEMFRDGKYDEVNAGKCIRAV